MTIKRLIQYLRYQYTPGEELSISEIQVLFDVTEVEFIGAVQLVTNERELRPVLLKGNNIKLVKK